MVGFRPAAEAIDRQNLASNAQSPLCEIVPAFSVLY
jgi:hypothetical protein